MSQVEIIADLLTLGTEETRFMFVPITAAKEAVLCLRDAYSRGAKMNGLAATLCEKDHPNYAKANLVHHIVP